MHIEEIQEKLPQCILYLHNTEDDVRIRYDSANINDMVDYLWFATIYLDKKLEFISHNELDYAWQSVVNQLLNNNNEFSEDHEFLCEDIVKNTVNNEIKEYYHDARFINKLQYEKYGLSEIPYNRLMQADFRIRINIPSDKLVFSSSVSAQEEEYAMFPY